MRACCTRTPIIHNSQTLRTPVHNCELAGWSGELVFRIRLPRLVRLLVMTAPRVHTMASRIHTDNTGADTDADADADADADIHTGYAWGEGAGHNTPARSRTEPQPVPQERVGASLACCRSRAIHLEPRTILCASPPAPLRLCPPAMSAAAAALSSSPPSRTRASHTSSLQPSP